MKPDFYIIALDETGDWNLSKDDPKHLVQKVRGVYLFDKNEVTHLCEITPSYCLYFIENSVIYADGATDEEINDIDSVIMSNQTDPVMYMHCQDVDRLLPTIPTYHYGSPYIKGQNGRNTPYEAALEGVLEYVRCNSVV